MKVTHDCWADGHAFLQPSLRSRLPGADLLGVDHDVRRVVDEGLILHAVPGTARGQIDHPYARRRCLSGLGRRYQLVGEPDGYQAVVGCDAAACGLLNESRRSDARLAGTLEADPPDAPPMARWTFLSAPACCPRSRSVVSPRWRAGLPGPRAMLATHRVLDAVSRVVRCAASDAYRAGVAFSWLAGSGSAAGATQPPRCGSVRGGGRCCGRWR